MVIIVEGIKTLYRIIEGLIPKETETSLTDIQFYWKLQSFIVSIEWNMDDIEDDLFYIYASIESIPLNKDIFLEFFGITQQYYDAKYSEASKSFNFQEQENQLYSYQHTLQMHFDSALNSIETIFTVHEQLCDDFDFITQSQYPGIEGTQEYASNISRARTSLPMAQAAMNNLKL